MIKKSVLMSLLLMFSISYAQKDCKTFTQQPNAVTLSIYGNYVPQPNYDCKKVVVKKIPKKTLKRKTDK